MARHARRAKAQGNLRALVKHAEAEARAAIEESGCARSIDRLGLASFFAGQAIAEARRSGNGRSSNVVALLAKARRVVGTRCAAGGKSLGRTDPTMKRRKRRKRSW